MIDCRGSVTSGGAHWDLKLGAVHLVFPPNAVFKTTSIVVYKWKCSACSPPLQGHDAIVSNVIEIATNTGQALEFNAEVKLFLCHSAPDLLGYELVIKKQINQESNEWEDVDGTRDLRCHQGLKMLFFCCPASGYYVFRCPIVGSSVSGSIVQVIVIIS